MPWPHKSQDTPSPHSGHLDPHHPQAREQAPLPPQPRPLVRHQPSRVLLPSALAGAVLLVAADLLIRLLPMDRDLMLGVVTSLVGAPFFFWLILRTGRGAPL